jgi:hypothetical protein
MKEHGTAQCLLRSRSSVNLKGELPLTIQGSHPLRDFGARLSAVSSPLSIRKALPIRKRYDRIAKWHSAGALND